MAPATATRLGVVDALSAGLDQARRRPWLMLIPAVLDLWFWLGPRISIEPLVRRLAQDWEGLLQVYYGPQGLAGMAEVLRSMRETTDQLASGVNLSEILAGGWLGLPSVVAQSHSTRMTFITDRVLAPAGLSLQLPHLAASPWPLAPIEIDSLGTLLLAVALLWLIGQFLLGVFMRWAAAGRPVPESGAGFGGARGLLRLVVRLGAFNLLVGVVVLLLLMPLAFAVTMLMVSSSGVLGMLALMFGGVALWLTLWFMLALFFVNEAVLLEHQPLGRALARSITLVHQNFGASLGFVAVINLLMYGFRIVWDFLGATPVGVVVAIAANAYLGASMLLAIFAFYESVRKAAVAPRAKVVS